MVIAGSGPVMRQARDIMAADRATTAADRACILVAVIISVTTAVTMAAITVVAVITVVVVTTVVVVIEYLSSARLSVTRTDRDLPVRYFPCHSVRTAAKIRIGSSTLCRWPPKILSASISDGAGDHHPRCARKWKVFSGAGHVRS